METTILIKILSWTIAICIPILSILNLIVLLFLVYDFFKKTFFKSFNKRNSFATESIDINDIMISDCYKNTTPQTSKIKSKLKYINKYHLLKSPIVLNKSNRLIDGYITYLILKKFGVKKIQFYAIGNRKVSTVNIGKVNLKKLSEFIEQSKGCTEIDIS